MSLGVEGYLCISATVSLQGLFGGEQEPNVLEGGGMRHADVCAEAAIHKINLS